MAKVLAHSKNAGFTLIEILAALAILAIAILGFRNGQTGVAKLTIASERNGQALALAQKQMTELEINLRSKGVKGVPDEEKGDFKDDAFKDYHWVRKLEKVDVGCFMPKEPGKNSTEDGVTQIFDKVVQELVRKLVVTVEWEEGNKKRSQSVAQLYVDFKNMPTNLIPGNK